MAKFHINPKGEAGVCKARSGSCPFGGEEEHYGSPEAARTAFEDNMKSEYTLVNSIYRKDSDKTSEDISKPVKERLIRDVEAGTSRFSPTVIGKVLSQDKDASIRARVASSISSQKIINSLGTDESRQVRVAVAAATNNVTLLRDLLKDEAKLVRDAAAANPKAPRPRKSATKALQGKGVTSKHKAQVAAAVAAANSTKPAASAATA